MAKILTPSLDEDLSSSESLSHFTAESPLTSSAKGSGTWTELDEQTQDMEEWPELGDCWEDSDEEDTTVRRESVKDTPVEEDVTSRSSAPAVNGTIHQSKIIQFMVNNNSKNEGADTVRIMIARWIWVMKNRRILVLLTPRIGPPWLAILSGLKLTLFIASRFGVDTKAVLSVQDVQTQKAHRYCTVLFELLSA